MRWFVFAVLLVGCAATSRPPQVAPAATPKPLAIEIHAELAKQLASGMPIHVELQLASRSVGTCTIAFDLWDEHYTIRRADIAHANAANPQLAARGCLDVKLLDAARRAAPHAHVVVVREREPAPRFGPRTPDYLVY